MIRRADSAAVLSPPDAADAEGAADEIALLLQRLARPGEPAVATLELVKRCFARLARQAQQASHVTSVGAPADHRRVEAAEAAALRVRWIDCELRGYGHSGAVSLRDIFGVDEQHPLLGRVRGYRQYTGRVRSAAAARLGRDAGLQVPYFFGEPIASLHHLRANADAIGLPCLEVELVTSGLAAELPSGAPARTLEFPRHVFYLILAGLTVELELALQTLQTR